MFFKKFLLPNFYRKNTNFYFARIEIILFYNANFDVTYQYKKMFSHSSQIRIRYSETDQMGYCYYGNYAQFFEIGRVETLREIGVPYRDLRRARNHVTSP